MEHNHLSLFVIANHTHEFLKHKPTFQWELSGTLHLKQNFLNLFQWTGKILCMYVTLYIWNLLKIDYFNK